MTFSSFAGLALLLLGVLAGPTSAVALEQVVFDAASFKADLVAGKPVVVHISAPWCPTCWAQHLVVRAFRADHQSTLIAFHGAREMGRTVGDASIEGIGGLLASSLK